MPGIKRYPDGGGFAKKFLSAKPDLVLRLRYDADRNLNGSPLLKEAADRIEALEAALKAAEQQSGDARD